MRGKDCLLEWKTTLINKQRENLKKILNNRNIILNFVFLLIHIYFTHYFTGFIVHIYIYIDF